MKNIILHYCAVLKIFTCASKPGFLKSGHKLRLYYHSVSLYLSLMSELKAFKVILEYNNEARHIKKWVWHMHNEIV